MELRASLVFGRFLLLASSEEVRCYDLNLDTRGCDSVASVIYRGSLRSFHCVSAVDVDGHQFACVVLNEETQTSRT